MASTAKKSASDTPSNFGCLRELTAVTGKREAELLASVLVTSGQIARGIVKLCQAQDTILKRSKALTNISRLETSIKFLEDSSAFYRMTEKTHKTELAK